MKRRDLAYGPLARRSIGYFTEDCWAAGAGCGGKVRGALVKGFVGEKGKGKSLLGVFGNAKTPRGQDFDAGKGGGKLSEDQGIVRATAGNDELVNFRFGQNETVQRIDNRECGEDRGCADEVVGLGAMAAAQGEEFFQISVAVVFAAGGFGWCELQIGIAHEVVEKRGNTAALGCDASVFVETLAPAREMRDESVDEHVGGASVESEDLLRLGGPRKNRNVG